MSYLHFDCSFQYPAGFSLELQFEMVHPITVLKGPSGCGKTTVLNLIAGLRSPHRGLIQLEDQILVDTASKKFLCIEKRHVGFVFQDYQLFPHFNVEQNLRYGAIRSKSSQPTRQLFQKAVDVLDIADLLQRYPATLSGGQKQRVALGRAFLSSPRLLLLDEPLAAIDIQHRQIVTQFLLDAIQEFQIPTILVSHDNHGVNRLSGAEIIME